MTERKAMDFRPLSEKEKDKDRELIRGIPRILANAGYTIVEARGLTLTSSSTSNGDVGL